MVYGEFMNQSYHLTIKFGYNGKKEGFQESSAFDATSFEDAIRYATNQARKLAETPKLTVGEFILTLD